MKHLILVFFLLPLSLFAQKTHKVGPKETLFSIGRLYNVNPKELAAFNNISPETAVKIGQVLKIPNTTNSTDAGPKPSTTASTKTTSVEEKGKPIYHKVQKKETLFQISSKYPGASVEKIKKWNKLTGDGVNEGANLIVGWSGNATAEVTTNATAKTNVSNNTSNTVATNNASQSVTQTIATPNVNVAADGGYFKKSFVKIEGIVSESGSVGVFKSTSGWEDGKYYCLFNKASSGTIVKIVNPLNKKYVYAKVLDVMPDLQQNKDLLIRLSNAAASQLDMKEDNFNADISY